MRFRLVTTSSKRWDRAQAELLRLHREASDAATDVHTEPDWSASLARTEALEDALDVLLEARLGLHPPAVRQSRNGVGTRSEPEQSMVRDLPGVSLRCPDCGTETGEHTARCGFFIPGDIR